MNDSRVSWLEQEVERKDAALTVCLNALNQLARTGSLHKEKREDAITKALEALNERLF